MLKEIAPTQAVKYQLAKVFGGEVDESKIAIFECIALNTQPINKMGSIFHAARHTVDFLRAMADHVAAGNGVPLHTLHAQGYQLPVGKVFMAELRGDELRTLFYIGRDTEQGTELIAKLNSGTIDEVSVGVRHQSAKCSKCGFDYFAEGNLKYLWDRTCKNEHTLGEDGAHLVLDGLDRWLELSLVSLGAAKNAKIVGRAQSVLGKDEYNRLAASGADPDVTTLFAVAGKVLSHEKPKETPMADDKPNMEAGFALVASLSAEKATLNVQLEAANAKAADLEAKLTAAAAKVTDLEKQLEAAAEGAKIKDEHGKIVAFLSEQTKAAMVASGVSNPVVPATVPEMLAALEESKLKLHNLPKGQQAEGSAADGQADVKLSAVSPAFKLKK